MKKFYSMITLMAIFAVASTLQACPPKGNTEAIAVATATGAPDPAFAATSIGVKLNLSNIESYVFSVEEGENKPSLDPVVMYADAKQIIKAGDGEHLTYVYGVEGAKSYTVHYAFKVMGENRYLSQSVNSKTAAYNQIINLIVADHSEIKVHINVPENQNFRYIIRDRAGYFDSKATGDDLSMLRHGIKKKGPQIISYKDGNPTGITDPETGKPLNALVKPGGAFVVIVAYCDEMGEIDYKGGDRPWTAPQYVTSIQPNQKEYTEKCEDTNYTLTEPYAKMFLVAAAPATGVGNFAINSLITELSSIFSITPPASVIRYGAVLMPKSSYEEHIAILGQDGTMEYIQRNMQPLKGEQTISNGTQPLQKDTTYMLVLIGECNASSTVQIHNTLEFKPYVSTKPAAELQITNVTNFTKDGPYNVTYNIKAPARNCFGARYILDYVKEVEAMLGSAVTYEDIIFNYSKPMNEAELGLINSEEGLTLPFDTFEDMDNRLIVASFNDEEKMKIFHLDARSGLEPVKPKPNTQLFTSLLGTWEVKAVFHYTDIVNPPTETTKFFTTITNSPAEADPNFGPGYGNYSVIMAFYKNLARMQGVPEADRETWATNAIAVDLKKYKETVPKFTKKYSEQNRLVLNGFEFKKGARGLQYKSSWDLFCDPLYASYDVDQLFFDYGTKLFFEIRENDQVTLETNRAFIAPFNYNDGHYIAGGFKDNTSCFSSFPVKIVNADSMVLNYKTTFGGTTYPFSIINGQNGMSEVIFDADLEFKRVKGQVAAPARSASPFTYTVPAPNRVHRTRLSAVPYKSKKNDATPVEVSIFNGITR